MRSVGRAGLAAIAVASLGGCAALRSSAKPVTPIDTRVGYVAAYPEAEIYRNFFLSEDKCGSCRQGLSQTEYRNMIAALYMSAADARYEQFRTALAVEAKGTAFGGNLGVLLVNGIAVVSGNEARRALAAGSAVVAGGQAAVSKDLFVDKTLAAVLAAMDANRSEAKTTIVTKLRLDAMQYTLPDVMADIRHLEDQARLDAAIQKLTATASADAADKKRQLDVAYTVKLQGPLAPRKQALLKDIQALDDTKLGQAADQLGVVRNADRVGQIASIRIWFNQNVQSEAAFDAAVSKVKSLTGKDNYP